VSASVGLTTCALPNEYDIEQLFRVADTALYAAKDIGRNSVNYMHYQSLKR
jgi:PleD family two-component response regulator